MRSIKLPSWTRRLLGFDPVQGPPHVFQLARRRLRYGQFLRTGGAGFRFRGLRSVDLPADAFHSGPLGGPLRDPQGFRERVGELVREAPGGVREASLVVPVDFLRLPLIAGIGALWYGESLDISILIGAAVIFAGTYYSIRYESRR